MSKANDAKEVVSTPKAVYTAYADFSFNFKDEEYSCKAGDVFELPRGMVEVPQDSGVDGLRFQYSTYLSSVDEVKGTKEKIEMPHYMILPLNRG